MSYRSGKGKNGHRVDAKQLVRQRKDIVAIDPDICGREDLEEEDVVGAPVRPARPRNANTNQGRGNVDARSRQLVSGAGGNTNRTLICTVVTVRNAASSGLKHVLESLSKFLETFRPIAPQVRETDIEFYIADDREAEAIRSLTRRIPDVRNRNNRLIINIRKVAAPWGLLDKQIRDVISKVMNQRYNKTLNSLDLSDFGGDSEFTSKKILCSLGRHDVMVYICNVIEKQFSNITKLSLKDNRLRSMIYPSSLVYRCKNIKVLDLSNNDFTKIDDLERISAWNIEKLLLENNPFCTNYTDAETYTRDVHKYLPTVTYLDGFDVTATAEVRNGRSTLLPKPRLGYCDNDEVRKVIGTFLEQYIALYDCEDPASGRKALLPAYHADAEFTYSINTVNNHLQSRGDPEIYTAYLRGSRNIIYEDRWAAKPETVRYKGAMDIAVQLSKLPATKHLLDTLLFDVGFYLNDLCGFTLRGLFIDAKEKDQERPHHRMFMRNFLVLSTGEGTMAILCDTFQVVGITPSAVDSYKEMLTEAATVDTSAQAGSSGVHQAAHTNITGVPAIVVTAPPPTPQPVDENIKRQMIEQFSAQTGMIPVYSERCLMDNNFDYEAAGRRFLEIRDEIPPEAFAR